MDFGVSKIKAPRLVATPLPPRNLSQTGKQMAEHGEERRRGHDELLMRSAEQRPRHQNRSQTFGGVKKQSRNPECRRLAGHVRRANVAAAARAHVLALENPYQQVAKWDRPQQIAHSGGDEVGYSCSSDLVTAACRWSAGRSPSGGTGETLVAPLPVAGAESVAASCTSILLVKAGSDRE